MAMKKKFSKRELIARLAEALSTIAGAKYAVGGAEAMAAHGYVRQTKDIDIFVAEDDLNRIMHALRKVGLKTFPISEPSHFAAALRGDPDIERRIDVLVPAGEPELSAIEHAVEMKRYGQLWRVFRPNLLAVAKFYAAHHGGDPKHQLDLLAMYRRGIFDGDAVREMIAYLDKDDAKAFDKMIASFKRRPTDSGPRTTKRLPPPPEG
jgi:hypothetical protein